MTISETLALFEEIRKLYPNDKVFVNPSLEQIQTWQTALKDMPYQQATEELARHAMSNKYAPSIADIKHKRKYNAMLDGYEQKGISDEDFEKLVVLDINGWHNNGQYHNQTF